MPVPECKGGISGRKTVSCYPLYGDVPLLAKILFTLPAQQVLEAMTAGDFFVLGFLRVVDAQNKKRHGSSPHNCIHCREVFVHLGTFIFGTGAELREDLRMLHRRQ